MTDSSLQRPTNAPSAGRRAPAVPPSLPAWRPVEPAGPVTPYDDIWFQGRPQQP